MKNRIINWVGKHEKIHFVLKCLRHINDREFVHDRLHLEDDQNILRLMQNGDKHKGKILYKIDINYYNGFCATLRYVLLQMYMADAWGAYPVVVAGEKFPYYEPDGVEGEKNPWEYYFRQYDNMKVADLDEAYRIVKDTRNLWGRYVREIKGKISYYTDESLYTELAPILSKYIRLQPRVENYIKTSISNLLRDDRTLGVQIRMGSMLINCDGHPVVPSLEEYAEEIQKITEEGQYNKIYLATDDKRALDYMKKRFHGKIVYYDDVSRVQSKCSPFDLDEKRPLHRYKCGLEVLRDVYTLAACDALVAGMSGVSIVARLVKLSKKEQYRYCTIVDKGLNNNNRCASSGEVMELVKKEAQKES